MPSNTELPADDSHPTQEEIKITGTYDNTTEAVWITNRESNSSRITVRIREEKRLRKASPHVGIGVVEYSSDLTVLSEQLRCLFLLEEDPNGFRSLFILRFIPRGAE